LRACLISGPTRDVSHGSTREPVSREPQNILRDLRGGQTVRPNNFRS
jgi:hypothetical protein